MRVLLAGGGSGGHVTPLRAIVESLRASSNQVLDVTVVTDRGFYAETIKIFADDSEVRLKKVFSGKYRRYKSKSFLWHILHLPTFLKNLRDIFLLGIGVLQSVLYFMLHKPDVVFCKGGFVCVPIGLAARLFKVPLIIHDSDTRPGLTNRILSRWAWKIGTGMPTSFYPYPKERVIYTGIPVHAAYAPLTRDKQNEYKASLNIEPGTPVVLITGGGNGAISLNKAVAAAAPQLLEAGFMIIHLAGRGKAKALTRIKDDLPDSIKDRWRIEEFASMVPRMLAADVVICRTSASTLQECANAKKAVIGVASPHLDDQKMNAEFFASKKAIISLDETELSEDGSDLAQAVIELYKNTKTAAKYAGNLHANFAKPQAANTLAATLLEAGGSS